MMTPAAKERRASRRAALNADFTPEQISKATRGLTVAAYCMSFNAGANRTHSEDVELDDALARYMSRGVKTAAHEAAWLDGNTYGDEGYPEDHIRTRAHEALPLMEQARRNVAAKKEQS